MATEYKRVQLYRRTAAQWTSANPTLLNGEQGWETDTDKLKIGDGSTAWNSLNYHSGGNYVTGTFTPTINFGGGSTGITYSIQSGFYNKFGDTIHYSGYVVLTSKGTSTGQAAIGGLPETSLNTTNYVSPASFRFSGISFNDFFQGHIIANSTSILLYEVTTAGANSTITDANFTNSSTIMFSGSYQVDT